MAPLDAATLLDHAILLGLITREQAREVRSEAEDRELDTICRVLLRKGILTSWQLERVKKGDSAGFFYGGCKVLFHLAEGTFARVYRGTRENGEPVAIKVLRKRFATDHESVARFNTEAQEGMKLRHPNIVQIIDYGDVDRQHYMIMEYVEGSNLRDLLKIRQRLDPAVALPMMIGLAEGLKYSFVQGVTHRDIKGSNVLVSTSGVAKLVDFGLATIVEGEGKKAASVNPRTVDYSALERTCKSEKGDPRSDIFFLGCVFYQMLTGQVAMPETETKDMLAKMLKRSFGAIKPLSDQRYAPDPELCRIIEKMMKVELEARYQTIDEVIHNLEAYEAQRSPDFHPPASDEFAFDEQSIFLHPVRGDDATKQETAQVQVAALPKYVLCVESQGEIQDAFRKTLTKMGYRVLLVGDPERAAERYREQPPDAVIFDVDGLGPEAFDAFLDMHEKAHEDGHPLAAIVLLGPRQLTLKDKLPTDDNLVVLSKPLKMKQVQDAIVRVLPIT